MNKITRCLCSAFLISMVSLPLFSCDTTSNGQLESQIESLEKEKEELLKIQQQLEEKIKANEKEYLEKVQEILNSHSEEVNAYNEQISTLKATYNNDVSKLKSDYQYQVNLNKLEKDKLEQEKASIELAHNQKIREIEDKYNSLKNEDQVLKATYEAKIYTLNQTHANDVASLNEKIADLNKNNEAIKLQYENDLKDLELDHQKQIASLNESYDKLKASQVEEIKGYQNEIVELNEKYNKKLTSLNDQLDSVRLSQDNLRKSYDERIANLNSSYDNEVNRLNNQIDSLNQAKSKLEMEQMELKTNYANELNALNAAHNDEILALNTSIRELKEANNNLTLDYENQISDANRETKAKIDELNQKINSLNGENASLKAKYQQEISDLKVSNEQKITSLNTKLNELKQTNNNLITSYEGEINTLKWNHEEELSTLSENYNQQLSKVNLELIDVKAKNETLITDYERQIETLTTTHTDEVNKLTSELDSKTKENEALKVSYQDEITKLKQDNAVDKQILNSKINSLNQTIETNDLNHQNEVKNLTTTYEAKVKALNDNVDKLTLENENLIKTHNEEITSLNKTHENEVNTLNTKITNLNADIDNLNKTHKEEIATLNEDHQNTVNTMQSEIDTLNDDMTRAQNEYDQNLNNITTQYEGLLENLNNQMSMRDTFHQQEIDRLNQTHQQEINSLENEKNSLQNQLNELQQHGDSTNYVGLKYVANKLTHDYSKDSVKQNNFNLPTHIEIEDGNFDLVKANISYTVNITNGKTDAVKLGNKTGSEQQFIVSYNETNYLDTTFEIEGQITDESSNKESFKLNYTVPAYTYNTYADYIKAIDTNSNQEIAIIGHVLTATGTDLYVQSDYNGICYQVYKPADVQLTKLDIMNFYPAGSKVVVKGKTQKYNGQYQFRSGSKVTKVHNAVHPFIATSYDATSVFANATQESYVNDLNAYQNGLITLKDVTLQDKLPDGNTFTFKVGSSPVTYSMSCLNAYGVLLLNEEARALFDNWNYGYKADLKGLLKRNNDSYMLEVYKDDSVKITSTAINVDTELANSLTKVEGSFASELKEGSVDLLMNDSNGVSLSYKVVTGTTVKIENGKLVITPESVATTNTIEVTASLDGKSEVKEVTVKVEAKALPLPTRNYKTVSEVLELQDNTKVTLRGTVKSIDTPWSDKFKNMSVVITDGTKDILVFRTKTNGLAVGQEVMVNGTKSNHKGTPQIAQDSTTKIAKYEGMTLIEDALKAKVGTKVSILGTVKEITSPWDGKKMSYILKDVFDQEILVKDSTTNVTANAEIVVSGTIANDGTTNSINGATSKTLQDYLNPGTTPDAGAPITASYSGSTTNMTGGNDAALIGLDNTKWTVVSAKSGSQSQQVGLNKAGEIRIYKNNTLTFTYTGKITKVKFNPAVSVTVKVNGKAVNKNTDNSYTINGSSFEVSSTGTVKIKSIELYVA